MNNLRLPANNFYWATLDASVLPARPIRDQLGYLFESVLPLPIDEVQAAYVPAGDRRYVACATRRDRLRELANGAVTLTPQALPAFIGLPIDCTKLNLLTAEFEPKPVTRLRRTWLSQIAAIVLICSAVMTIGLEARTRQIRAEVHSLRDARNGIFAEVVGPASGSAQPPELRLLAELRTLRQTRSRPSTDAQLDDVTPHLVALLSAWPRSTDLHAQTEHIAITPAAITLRATLPGSAGAESFAQQLSQVREWQLHQPQITASRDAVQASLRFSPQRVTTDKGRTAAQ